MKQLVYAEPWKRCGAIERLLFNDELAKEINGEHPLYRVDFRAVARRNDTHQVLYSLHGAVFNWAVVHLTWKSEVVSDYLPDVDFYISRQEWIERCMNCPWC